MPLCKGKGSTAPHEYDKTRYTQCPECHVESGRRAKAAYKKRNPDLERAGDRKRYRKDAARRREAKRFAAYPGFTKQDHDDMYALQSGLCAICRKRKATCIDHDHETGHIRGLLCHGCNTSLGVFGDNECGILKVLTYLRRDS